MTMKKLMMVLFLVLALTFAAAGMADEVPAGLIGEWEMVPNPEMDGSYGFIFTETEMTMTMTEYGETQSMTMPYTIEGDTIVANGEPEKYVLAGDTLTIGEGDYAVTFTRKGAAPAASAVPAGLIGEWELTAIDGEAMEGANVVYAFTETEVSMKATIGDIVQEDSTQYTVEGDAIVANGIPVSFVLDGDNLTLSDTYQSMTFVRKRTDDVAADGIIGEWKVTELLGDDEEAQSMQLLIEMGGVITVTFTETDMTLSTNILGQTMEKVNKYSLANDQIISNGVGLSYVLEGDTLTISDGEVGMVLVRVGSEADVKPAENAAEPRRSDSIIGEWTLINITGNEEAEGLWQVMSAMGGTIDLTITENSAVLSVQAMGESYEEIIDCTIVDNTVVDENGEVQLVLEDGLVKMYDEEGIVLVFQVK